MSVSSESQSRSKDTLLWGIILMILAATVIGNWWVGKYFNNVNIAFRALGVLVALAGAAMLSVQTVKGKATLAFARESRLEVRKVVWPTRQEAIQTTLIVLAVTAVMGLLLFVLDGALVWLVSLITGV